MSGPLALVAGAGGVLGEALLREFAAAGYRAVGLRRGGLVVDGQVRHGECDLGNAERTGAAVAAAAAEFGNIDVLVWNAAHFRAGPFAELRIEDFESAWRAAVAGAVGAAGAVLPGMLARGRGAILFSGATASLRGAANFAPFASAKFALRGLAQSLAREYQPRGVHVAHVVIDGVLRASASARRFGVADECAIDPDDAAAVYRWLAEQPSSAWTHEIDIRPASERF